MNGISPCNYSPQGNNFGHRPPAVDIQRLNQDTKNGLGDMPPLSGTPVPNGPNDCFPCGGVSNNFMQPTGNMLGYGASAFPAFFGGLYGGIIPPIPILPFAAGAVGAGYF